ncbi:hypothetical protein O6H91_03G098300 [Diphasiastrum complanatum]|nr:hypothetical protein O6H91_03G098300 [Diphasiastrum complanatum]
MACDIGNRNRTYYTYSRANQLVEYFRCAPRLKSTPLHFSFLLRYGAHLYYHRKVDEALQLFTEAKHLSSGKADLLRFQAMACALSAAVLMKMDRSGEKSQQLYRSCVDLLEHAPEKDKADLILLLAGCYIALQDPGQAYDILTQLLVENSEGKATPRPALIFKNMSEACKQLEDFKAALVLAEQAMFAFESEGRSASEEVAEMNGVIASLLYQIGDNEGAKVYANKFVDMESQWRQTDPLHLVDMLRLKAKIRYADYIQDWGPKREGGFRISKDDALISMENSIQEYEEAAVHLNPTAATSKEGETLENLQENYRWVKEEKQADIADIFSAGITLCRYYLREEVRPAITEETLKEVIVPVVVEIYNNQLLPAAEHATISIGIIDMMTDLADVCLAFRLISVSKILLAYILSHVSAMQLSIADVSSDAILVNSSNSHKITYIQMVRAHLMEFDNTANPDSSWKALVWSERSKARALGCELSHYARVKASDFKASISRFLVNQRQFDTDDEYARDVIGEYLLACKRTLVMEYTLLGSDRLCITLISAAGDDGVNARGCLVVHKYVKLEEELDEVTKEEARSEFRLMSEKCLKRRPSGSSDLSSSSSTSADGHSATQERLLAENVGRGQITSVLILGLVARVQRLEAEAEKMLTKSKDSKTDVFQRNESKLLAEVTIHKVHKALEQLHKILIEPFAGVLDACKLSGYNVLLVIPDEDIALVPFAALRKEHGTYLIEQFAVCMAPSIRIASFCMHSYSIIKQGPSQSELVVGRTDGYLSPWPNLNNAKNEVNAVRQSFSPSGLWKLFGKEDQNAKSFVLQHLREASWLHLTFHGEISEQYPRGSLILGQERLSGHEIVSCGPLSARAAVLSACVTGLGVLRGEGVLGFSRAFLLAGVPITVVSYWKVRDHITANFMKKLYKKLRKPKAHVVIAMQELIVEMINETKKSTNKLNLLDWASFYCVGFPYVEFPTQDSS